MYSTHILGSSFLCWAFSCATMIRASCSILVHKLFEAGKIDEDRKHDCLKVIRIPYNHRKIRNLVAMILLPKKLHKNDESQAAFLRAAVSRVSWKSEFIDTMNSQIQSKERMLLRIWLWFSKSAWLNSPPTNKRQGLNFRQIYESLMFSDRKTNFLKLFLESEAKSSQISQPD